MFAYIVRRALQSVLVMASVFIPAAFLPGTTGQLYKQFAITIVISVALSGFVALTLTPAMCGFMLKHSAPPQKGPFAWFNRMFDRFTLKFGDAVVLMIKRMGVAFVILATFGAVTTLKCAGLSLLSPRVPAEDDDRRFLHLLMNCGGTLAAASIWFKDAVVAGLETQFLLREEYLPHDFRGGQVAVEALLAGGAERAVERATRLARHAERAAVGLGNEDGLNRVARAHVEEPLHGPVGRHPLGDHRQSLHDRLLGQFVTQRPRKVGHG